MDHPVAGEPVVPSGAAGPTRRVDGLLSIEYGLMTLAVPGAVPLPALRPYRNGLVVAVDAAAADGAVAVFQCAARDEDIHVTLEWWSTAPPQWTDDWQDVAEVTVGWPGGSPRLVGTADGPYPEVTLSAAVPAGRYRLRAAGRNRDGGEAPAPGTPVEDYLVRLWPPADGEHPSDVLVKATSELGAYWRRAAPAEPRQSPQGQQ